MRTKHRVSRKYLAWLVPSLAAVFLAAATFIAVQDYRARSRELQQKADRTALLAALLFQNPVWNLDGAQIQQNMDALTLDPEIAAITVTASSSGDMAKHPERIRPGLLVRKVLVTDPGTHASRIGEVTLYLSQDLLLHKVRLRVLGLAGVMLLGLATMTALHGLIHRRVITAPLDDLLGGILRNSEGRPFQPVPVRSEDEIGQLGQAFNTMMKRLRTYQEDLEGMVAQRIKQLVHAQQLLSATLDALPVFIAILDEHHTVLATNRKWTACGPGNPFIAQARAGSDYRAVCEAVARDRGFRTAGLRPGHGPGPPLLHHAGQAVRHRRSLPCGAAARGRHARPDHGGPAAPGAETGGHRPSRRRHRP
jgi:HAMP domain-containing protein